jgi:hypothetical protein
VFSGAEKIGLTTLLLKKQKASAETQWSFGGSTLTTFWKHKIMVSSQKDGVMLSVFQKLDGMN